MDGGDRLSWSSRVDEWGWRQKLVITTKGRCCFRWCGGRFSRLRSGLLCDRSLWERLFFCGSLDLERVFWQNSMLLRHEFAEKYGSIGEADLVGLITIICGPDLVKVHFDEAVECWHRNLPGPVVDGVAESLLGTEATEHASAIGCAIRALAAGTIVLDEVLQVLVVFPGGMPQRGSVDLADTAFGVTRNGIFLVVELLVCVFVGVALHDLVHICHTWIVWL